MCGAMVRVNCDSLKAMATPLPKMRFNEPRIQNATVKLFRSNRLQTGKRINNTGHAMEHPRKTPTVPKRAFRLGKTRMIQSVCDRPVVPRTMEI